MGFLSLFPPSQEQRSFQMGPNAEVSVYRVSIRQFGVCRMEISSEIPFLFIAPSPPENMFGVCRQERTHGWDRDQSSGRIQNGAETQMLFGLFVQRSFHQQMLLDRYFHFLTPFPSWFSPI